MPTISEVFDMITGRRKKKKKPAETDSTEGPETYGGYTPEGKKRRKRLMDEAGER
jgi:hypothetical protein